ncbi:MAG TPA: response regulator [Puia sp.]|nr:response regulator [Puia sp.]
MPVVNRKFLLADDDADDASLFCEALSKIATDMECSTAENGAELFEVLSRRYPDKPDVIFLDINMPIMNGWDTLRKLKESSNYQNIPIIMYSTSSAKKDVELAYHLGVSLFLTKPEDFRELSAILEIVATHPKESLVRQLVGFKNVKMN